MTDGTWVTTGECGLSRRPSGQYAARGGFLFEEDNACCDIGCKEEKR